MTAEAFASAFRTSLSAAAESARLELSPDQLDAATFYASELSRWNARAGLTTLEDPVSIARRHFLESFLLAELLPDQPLQGLDIGSGGGFPGLALTILRPRASMTLLEPRQAKAAFLRHVARGLRGGAVEVLTQRLEDLPASRLWGFASFRGVRFPATALLRVLAPGALILGYSGDGLEAIVPDLVRAGANQVASRQIPGREGGIHAWKLPD